MGNAKNKGAMARYQIETVLKEAGRSMTALEMRQAMVGRWKQIPTPNQIGNLLTRNRRIEKVGMCKGSTLWNLVEEEE